MRQAQHHGVIVLDLFGGMGAMLEGILRTGFRVISYRHCDVDHVANQVMRHRLVGLMMQYPSQLDAGATSDTFDTMPADVQDITTTQLEELIQQMIATLTSSHICRRWISLPRPFSSRRVTQGTVSESQRAVLPKCGTDCKATANNGSRSSRSTRNWIHVGKCMHAAWSPEPRAYAKRISDHQQRFGSTSDIRRRNHGVICTPAAEYVDTLSGRNTAAVGGE